MDSFVLGVMAIRRSKWQPRSKSGIKIGSETSVQSSVQLDYSDTYRENDALEGDLEYQLDDLKKNQKRQLLEKGEQMKEIRKQVEVITRLQELVNNRKPGSSASLVARRSSRGSVHYGGLGGAGGAGLAKRRPSRPTLPKHEGGGGGGADSSTKKTSSQDIDVDFGTLAAATRTQMRVAAEREKFSAKNLFNQRRPKTAVGTYSGGGGAAGGDGSAPQRRFFAGPSASVNTGADIRAGTPTECWQGEEDEADTYSNAIIAVRIRNNSTKVTNGISSTLTENHAVNDYAVKGREQSSSTSDGGTSAAHLPDGPAVQYRRPATPKPHFRPSTASARRAGGILTNNNTEPPATPGNGGSTRKARYRPKTAVGFVTATEADCDFQANQDGVLPPRPKSRAARSRSRRELELLCRVLRPEEEEAALASVGDAADQLEMINERRRRRKLQDLRQQSSRLDAKVKDFLEDIQGFNRRRSLSSSAAQRRPSSAGFALRVEDI